MKNRFELKLLDAKNATREEWEKYHVFYEKVAEDNYPSLILKTVEDTMRVNGEYFDAWRDEHYQLIDTETDKIVGRIRYGYMEGTKDECNVWIDILKEYQRQGLSGMLLEKLNIWMKKNERTRASFWLNTSFPGYRKWIENLGGKEVLSLTVSRMYLAEIPEVYLDETTSVIKDDPDLGTELWFNEFPDKYMDSYLRLDKDFWATIPLGEDPPKRPDTTREFMMNWLETMSKKALDSYMLVAIDKRTDEVISFTHCLLNKTVNDRMHQLGTGTLTPYKKRGIAKALKSMMVELVKEKLPTVEFIFTENAVNNPPMLAINEAMGFKKWHTQRKFNLKKEDLEQHLEKVLNG